MFLCTSSVDMSREADLLESENCEIELVLDVLCCNIIAIFHSLQLFSDI